MGSSELKRTQFSEDSRLSRGRLSDIGTLKTIAPKFKGEADQAYSEIGQELSVQN